MNKPKPKPKRGVSLELIATAVAEADREPDAKVAERYGVAPTTIRTWRRRATSEPELGELVTVARRKAIDTWRPEAASTLVALLGEMRRLIQEGQEIPFTLIASIKTIGALNVEAGALLGDAGKEGEG